MSSSQRQTVTAFIALAVLAGPVVSFVYGPIGFGAQYLSSIQMAVGSGLAGVALLLLALVRRERMPRGAEFLALVALLVPQWLAGLLGPPAIRAVPALHETPWGVAFLVSLAAPLWLGLLSALRLIRDEVPRRIAAASIAGIGAVCLVIPVNAYTIALPQIPVAMLHLLLGVLTVFSWSYARPRLAAVGTASASGCYLLLTALSATAARSLVAVGPPSPLDWRASMLPLLLTALVSAVTWWLWFWLLERMTLAAFGMRTLALWTAAALPGFAMFGFLSWRVDAAMAISVAALVVALRARPGEEQPLALGLGDR
jgi:hypothetical protein